VNFVDCDSADRWRLAVECHLSGLPQLPNFQGDDVFMADPQQAIPGTGGVVFYIEEREDSFEGEFVLSFEDKEFAFGFAQAACRSRCDGVAD